MKEENVQRSEYLKMEGYTFFLTKAQKDKFTEWMLRNRVCAVGDGDFQKLEEINRNLLTPYYCQETDIKMTTEVNPQTGKPGITKNEITKSNVGSQGAVAFEEGIQELSFNW